MCILGLRKREYHATVFLLIGETLFDSLLMTSWLENVNVVFPIDGKA